MATAEMTEKQRRALEALQGAQREGKALSEYAKAHGLAIWELYNALACLRRKGVLPKAERTRNPRGKFLAVRVVPQRPIPAPPSSGMICRLVHRDGYVIECAAWPPPSWLAALARESSDAAP
jgi:hypothetical protein